MTTVKKLKKLGDLLEGLREPVKECNLVTHTLNDLSNKYEGVSWIIQFTKPSFSEMRSMLSVEETQLISPSITTHLHDSHSSTLLHVGST